MRILLVGIDHDPLDALLRPWAGDVAHLPLSAIGPGPLVLPTVDAVILRVGEGEPPLERLRDLLAVLGPAAPVVAVLTPAAPGVAGQDPPDEARTLWLLRHGVPEVVPWSSGLTAAALEQACLRAQARHQANRPLPGLETGTLLMNILDTAPEPIFAKDGDGRYVLANLACCTVMGRRRDQVLGHGDADIFPAPVAAEILRVDAEVVASRTQIAFEEVIPTPTGERVYSTIKAPLFSQDGRVVGLVGVAKDITARARAQQELEERNRLLALAEDVAHVGHFYLHLDARRVEWSRLCYTLSGVEPDAFQPTFENHLRAVHPDDRVVLLDAQRLALKERTEVSREIRTCQADGTVRTAIVRLLADYEPGAERARGMFGIVFDTTDIHTARRAVEQKQQLLDMAVSSITDGLVLFDENDRLVMCNDSYRRMYDLPPDLVQPGTPFDTLLRATFDKGYYELEREEEAVQWLADRITLHQVGGSLEQRFRGRWYLVNEQRLPNGFRVGTRIDITTLKQAQLQATAASRAKTEFLSNMSHELRTPLNAVLGFAQLLLSSTREPLSERQEKSVRHILQAGEHLLTLITEILDLTRIEAGQLSLSPQRFFLQTLVAECLDFTETLARRHGVSLSLSPAPDLPAVWADPTRSRQVVLNLLSNAVKYNRPDGRVEVWLSLTQADGGPPMARLTVMDSGRGIPQDRQALLFQPFARLGQETSGIEGTGIGLSISARLVREMGGCIDFSSTEGEGSTFRVDFPLAQSGPTAI